MSDHPTVEAAMAAMTLRDAELARLRSELGAAISITQRYQPRGSPPPGGSQAMIRWILESQNARAEAAEARCKRAEKDRDTLAAEVALLREQDRITDRMAEIYDSGDPEDEADEFHGELAELLHRTASIEDDISAARAAADASGALERAGVA